MFCPEVAGYLPALSLTFGRLVGHRRDGREVDSNSKRQPVWLGMATLQVDSIESGTC